MLGMMLAGWLNRHHQDVIEYLKEENKILREKSAKRRMEIRTSRTRVATSGFVMRLRRDRTPRLVAVTMTGIFFRPFRAFCFWVFLLFPGAALRLPWATICRPVGADLKGRQGGGHNNLLFSIFY